MTLQNRWGDNVEKDGGLLGPDGQPLSSSSQGSKPEEPKDAPAEPTLDFFNYIASLGFQTMIFLGEMPNPMTNQVEKNLKQAKFLIDTLVILRDKTKGNLSKEEDDLLNGSIYELQMRYVDLIEMIDEKLLAILACPACQGDVVLKDNKIVCTRCQRVYPIVDGIPVLLVDQAAS